MKIFNNLKALDPDKKTIHMRDGNITVSDLFSYALGSQLQFSLSRKAEKQISDCYRAVINHTENGKHIYGVSAAYGGQAYRIITSKERNKRISLSRELSRAILHVDVSVGKPIPTAVTRAAMLIRLGVLSRGIS